MLGSIYIWDNQEYYLFFIDAECEYIMEVYADVCYLFGDDDLLLSNGNDESVLFHM